MRFRRKADSRTSSSEPTSTNGSPQGPPATAEDLRTILSKVSEVLIRADYYKSAKYQQTGLDDVALWDPGETTIRYGRPQRQEFYRPQ